VYVIDVRVMPSTVTAGKNNTLLQFTPNEILFEDTDEIAWSVRNLPCPQIAPTTGTADYTPAVPYRESSNVYDFSSVPASTPPKTLRACVYHGAEVLDMLGVAVNVVQLFNVKPASILGQKGQKVTFEHDSLVWTVHDDYVWLQRQYDNTGKFIPCSTHASVVASVDTSDSQRVQISGAEVVFDMSQVTSASMNQALFRVCTRNPATTLVRDLSDYGLRVIDVKSNPLSAQIGEISTKITFNVDGAGKANGGTSLRAGDQVWYQLESELCFNQIPEQATSTSSQAFAITKSGDTFLADLSQVANNSVSDHLRYRLCVKPISTLKAMPVPTLSYDVVGVRIIDVIIAEPRAVRLQAGQSITITYNRGSLSAGRIWFTNSGSCNYVADNQHTDKQAVQVSGLDNTARYTFDFGGKDTTTKGSFFGLCFQPTNEDALDFLSTGVFASDVAVSPTSVYRASGQSMVLSFTQNALQIGDTVIFIRQDTPCPEDAQGFVTDMKRSSFALVSGVSSSTAQVIPRKNINPTGTPDKYCPWWASTKSRFCDYRCPQNDKSCWIETFDFSGVGVSPIPYRVCTQKEDGRIIDFAVTTVYVIDLAVRPTSVLENTNAMVDFVSSLSSSSPSPLSLMAGDFTWFSSVKTCVSEAPVAQSTTGTQTVTYNNTAAQYIFNAGASSQTLWALCVKAGTGPSKRYSSIGIYITDIKIGVGSVTQQTTTVPYTGTSLKSSTSFDATSNIPSASDVVYFRVATEPCTVLGANVVSDTTTSSSVFVTPATTLATEFVNVIPSTTLLRMCVVATPDTLNLNLRYTLDYSTVGVVLTDIQMLTSVVPALVNQTIEVAQTVGLIEGDTVFFVETSAGCGVVPPTLPGTTTTNAITLGPITSTKLSLKPLDFSLVPASGSKFRLCRYTASNGLAHMQDLSGSVVTVVNTRITSGNVVRGSQSVDIDYTGDLNIPNNQVCFQKFDPSTACDCSKLPGSTTPVPTGPPYPGAPATQPVSKIFDFSSVSLSNTLLRMCIDVDDGNYVSYNNVGVYATDLVIGTSSDTAIRETECVKNAQQQLVMFKTSAPFSPGDKLFFKASDQTCGSVPTVSTTTSSDSVTMPPISQTHPTQTVQWKMAFDFSLSTVSTTAYRLCIYSEASSTKIMDFANLGLRVHSLNVGVRFGTNTPKLASNAIKPLKDQRVLMEGSFGSISTQALIRFITDGDARIDCQCADQNNCDVPLSEEFWTPYLPATNTFNSAGALFDFSKFNSPSAPPSGGAKLCVKDGTDIYEMNCIKMTFDLAFEPAELPANDGQMVTFKAEGINLRQGDQLVWKQRDVPCPEQHSFHNASEMRPTKYSSMGVFQSKDLPVEFSFDDMTPSVESLGLQLCVNSTAIVWSPTNVNLILRHKVVSLLGDPHVRAVDGSWMDFLGDAGVYQLLSGGGLEANARFGYAVRENFMIWHPKVMRPGTVVEEVGLKIGEVNIRLGVFGGGVVSVRRPVSTPEFWTSSQHRSIVAGGYQVEWSSSRTTKVLPWGIHERSNVLTIKGNGEFMQLFVAKAGGYRFIDVEAAPTATSSGLLADALSSPQLLAQSLKSGGEHEYKIATAFLSA